MMPTVSAMPRLNEGEHEPPEQALERLRKLRASGEQATAELKTALSKLYDEILGFEPEVPLSQSLEKLSRSAMLDVVVATRMRMGDNYEARVTIGSGAAIRGASRTAPVETAQVQIMDRGRALIESAHFKIERLSDEWQELHAGAGGLWMWRIEPLRPGTYEIIFTVQHSTKIKGVERQFTVSHFAQAALVEANWLQNAKMIFDGMPIAGQVAASLTTVAGLIGGGFAAARAWWKRKRRPKRTAKPRTSVASPS
jgi:hypothetical protein